MPFDNINYTPNDKILRTLIKARALITDPERWTTLVYMRFTGDMESVSRCAMGALYAAAGVVAGTVHSIETDGYYAPRLARHSPVHMCRDRVGSPDKYSVTVTNDTQDHAVVLAMFDGAIADRLAELMEVSHAA